MKRKNILKIFALVVTLVFIGQIAVSSTERISSDTVENIVVFIYNSKGNFWPATGPNLQLAIDDLTTGGTIYGNEFNITINSPIVWDEGINFEGAGKASILYLADGVNDDVIQINGKSNILISGICIRANGDAQTDNSVSCIDITGTSNNITIRDSYLYEGSKSLIDCQEGSSNILIEGNHLDGKKDCGYGGGIWLSGSDCIVRNNFIKDTWGSGVVMEAGTGLTPSRRHIIDGNVITGNIAHGIHMEAVKSDNVIITKNHVYDLNSTAYVATEGHWSKGIMAMNNSIVSKNRIENVQHCGIEGFYDVIISDNIIKNIESGNGTYCKNVGRKLISGNIYQNISSDMSDNGYGILLDSSVDISIISGNELYNIENFGIQGTQKLTIADNHLEKVTGYGIYAPTGSGGDAIISNNYIYEISSDGIHSNGDAVIMGNFMDECDGNGIHTSGYNMTIIGNIIKNIGAEGIKLETGNATVSINFIFKCVAEGIELESVLGCIIDGNRVTNCDDPGIEEKGTSNYNIISNNYCNNNNGDGVITIGANSIEDNNIE